MMTTKMTMKRRDQAAAGGNKGVAGEAEVPQKTMALRETQMALRSEFFRCTFAFALAP